MKGTITAYDAQRAVATVKLDNGAETTLHAAAYLDPKLPAVGDKIVCQLTGDSRRIGSARRVNPEPSVDSKGRLILKGDTYMIEVAHCVHCEGLTLAPQTDMCDCGAELYPVTKLVPLGVSLKFDQLKGG